MTTSWLTDPTCTQPAHFDIQCYLCPGNRRAQGDTNPDYKHTYVFANDYGAVKEHQERYEPEDDDPGSSACRRDPWNHLFVDAVDYLGSGRLLRAEPVTGKCYVVAFSPSHNITLADMSAEEIVLVVQKWTEMYASYISPSSCLYNKTENQHGNLERLDQGYRSTSAQYRYMQIFENKGPAMGCSNPHPHGQVWITTGLPEEPSLELEHLQRYRNEHAGHHMLEDYAKLERKKERVVFENSAFLVLCPWWAVWPFEVMILSKVHRCALIDLDRREQEQLAEAILEVTRRYDNLFETHFPYSEPHRFVRGNGDHKRIQRRMKKKRLKTA